MTADKIQEIKTDEKYSINYGTVDLFQLRKLETRLYDFNFFKIDEAAAGEIRINAGNKLYEYCKLNSIVISTDDADYDFQIVRFLEESGFRVKYKKIIYEKNLAEHKFAYDDIFEYKSLNETGPEYFMKVFERTADVGIEKDVSPFEYFNIIYQYAGDKYNPGNYLVVIHNNNETGIIMPQVFPHNVKEGTIFHLGVVPEHRNKGFGKIMHSKSLLILKHQGAEKYIGSTNFENKPMRRIFEINGCKEWFRRKFYFTG